MRHLPVAALGALALILVAGLGVLGYELMTGSGPAAGPAVGGPFALVDGNGHPVTDKSFQGKWMLIYFGYTHCPDACPTALSDMEAALGKLGARAGAVQAIFITVDPERDTPDVMRDYVAAFGSDIVGLTGTPEAVQAVEKEYRVYAAKHPTKDGGYDMDHSSVIYLIDPQGGLAAYFTHETSPGDMAKRLEQVVS